MGQYQSSPPPPAVETFPPLTREELVNDIHFKAYFKQKCDYLYSRKVKKCDYCRVSAVNKHFLSGNHFRGCIPCKEYYLAQYENEHETSLISSLRKQLQQYRPFSAHEEKRLVLSREELKQDLHFRAYAMEQAWYHQDRKDAVCKYCAMKAMGFFDVNHYLKCEPFLDYHLAQYEKKHEGAILSALRKQLRMLLPPPIYEI